MAVDILRMPIESMPGFSGILREQQSFGQGDEDESVGNSINSGFDKLMVQSGIEMAPGVLLFFCLFVGLLASGFVFVLQENLLTAGFVGAVGAAIPIIATMVVRTRRQQKMMEQLPSMIDELARSAKTGRSIQQCWEIVANDTAAPMGDELKLCSKRMRMGQDLPEAVHDLPYRTGIVTLNILVTALSVHHQTGGDLVSVLERLSQTIRDRLLFLGRLRAATTGSRATAVLMLGLPVFIVLFFSLRDPNYLPKLMESSMGQKVTMAAIGLQVIGSILIWNVLRNSQRN